LPSGCPDSDGDGHQAASCGGDDCNDGDASIHPGAAEVCDGVDNDCNGGTDEGCVDCDVDGDFFDGPQCSGGTDCDDNDPFIYPGAPEQCDNEVDDDCDGQVDEGCFDCDADNDGWMSRECGGSDCDDSRANVHPGATELCDGFDNDCDGTIDEGCNTCEDRDGDGYQNASCGGSDCNDSNPLINPGADEVCDNGGDDDCDGIIDEGCDICEDADRDGYEDESCGGSDCNDSNWLINPGADEICDNGSDDDCDGLIDAFDSDCATCADKKEQCASDDDCCSGRCHPRKNVCL
jgi:hypothetical protein